MPIFRPPRPHGIRRPFLLSDHLLGCQFDERIGDIAVVRHLRINRDGALIDQVDGIPAAVIVRFATQRIISVELLIIVPVKGVFHGTIHRKDRGGILLRPGALQFAHIRFLTSAQPCHQQCHTYKSQNLSHFSRFLSGHDYVSLTDEVSAKNA